MEQGECYLIYWIWTILTILNSLTSIQAKNREIFCARGYRDQGTEMGRFRFIIRSYDTTSLYRQHWQRQGINTKEQPHVNIHNWLNPKSQGYNHDLRSSIFHYAARTDANDRLEIGIATSDMKQASWRYAHQQQILLDGTFGVCDRRLLLFIVMAVDEQNHGVPLAFLLFSAPSGNRATAAGYDTSILIKMLSAWKQAVSASGDKTFLPAVAITDTDFKERGALSNVFSGIHLLIRKFHLRQSWRNSRTKVLRGTGTAGSMISERLRSLEVQLIQSTNWSNAQELVCLELAQLDKLSGVEPYALAANKGRTHVLYLSSYWMTEALWISWSERGRLVAAARTGLTINGIIPTTNHLESFNGTLKYKHLAHWSHGGRRIRVDVLVMILGVKIAPSIFQQRRIEEEEREMLRKALRDIPGGDAVMSGGVKVEPIRAPLAYVENDPGRETAAWWLVHSRRIGSPFIQDTGIQLTCVSAQVSGGPSDSNTPTYYTIWLGFDSTASCTCPDFQQRGGACKHMRAALHTTRQLKEWALQHPEQNHAILAAPDIVLPHDKATAIQWHNSSSQKGQPTGHMANVANLPSQRHAPNVVAQAANNIAELLQQEALFAGAEDTELGELEESLDEDWESASVEGSGLGDCDIDVVRIPLLMGKKSRR